MNSSGNAAGTRTNGSFMTDASPRLSETASTERLCDRESNSELFQNGLLMMIEAELRVPLATTRLVRFNLTKPGEPGDDIFVEEEAYRLDLSLKSRPHNARGCYPERWGPDRFERLGDMLFVPAGEVFRVRGDRACLTSI